jgi:hypothetical protein
MSNIGLTVLLIGAMLTIGSFVCRALRRVNRPADAAFDEGYEMGYDKGYHEGRRAPVLVALPSRDLAAVNSGS